MAVRKGCRLAAEDPTTPMVLETDNTVVSALMKSQIYRGPLHYIVVEAKQAGGLISEWKIVHTRKRGNCATQELTQLSLWSNSASVWRNEVPVCVEQIIAQDCNSTPKQRKSLSFSHKKILMSST
jgi:hypothetical protein